MKLSLSLSALCLCVSVVILGCALVLGGCANAGVAIYQSTIGGRAAVQATTPLVANGTAPVAVGKDVDTAGLTASAALVAWNQARLSGDTNALATAASAAEAALGTLESQLVNVQAVRLKSGDQVAAGQAAAAKLQLSKVKAFVSRSQPEASSKKGAISPQVVTALIDIAVQELPVLVNWVNSALSANTVTDAQIQTELDGFAADLAVLEQTIASKQ